MLVWVLLNTAYFLMILKFAEAKSSILITVYSFFIAALVIFKMVFATFYIIWWRLYKLCHPRLTLKVNLQQEVAAAKLLKKQRGDTEILDSELNTQLDELLLKKQDMLRSSPQR